jgi:hypothetical protein
MAFTPIALSTTPLLESTFISDMRLIVNANTTLLATQIEDIVNELQIDVVNKYIGTDLPVNQVYTQDLVVANQVIFKSGTSGTAATIATLTQSSGTSTFLVDNVSFNKNILSTAVGSKVATPTVVIGATSGTSVTFPTSGGAGIADQGLYVGDSGLPIKAGFYGEVEFAKQAVTQSVNTAKTINLTAGSGNLYTYGNLMLAKTDKQFIYLDLILPAGYSQNSELPIWLQLHDDYTTTTSRPAVGQTFTLIINRILQNGGVTEVAVSDWPEISSTYGLNIMPGWRQDSSAGVGNGKLGYINSGEWDGVPGSGTSAVAAVASGMTVKTYVHFFNVNIHNGGTLASNKRGSAIGLTKTEQFTQYSNYVITGGSNFAIINS